MKEREVSVLFFPTVTIKYNNEYSQRMVKHSKLVILNFMTVM